MTQPHPHIVSYYLQECTKTPHVPPEYIGMMNSKFPAVTLIE